MKFSKHAFFVNCVQCTENLNGEIARAKETGRRNKVCTKEIFVIPKILLSVLS